MKMNLYKVIIVCFFGTSTLCCSCNKTLVEYATGDLKIRIEKGSDYLHDFPLFMGIVRKNPPQMAVWLEDTLGNYLTTVYVTDKIARQGWIASGGNRRKEALPHWCYVRGVQYADGLYLPTKEEPLADGISGATPRTGFDLKLSPAAYLQHFIVKIEINHSTDFNDVYPESARENEPGYSGGKGGSGQPALVYASEVDLASGKRAFPAKFTGHSSPDGSDGAVDPDVSGCTTALHIVERIEIVVE